MFDKTGTLTIGKPVVVNVKLIDTIILEELLELTAATEVCFRHRKLVRNFIIFENEFRNSNALFFDVSLSG